jgi:single-strand DNA-binding protein
MNNTILLVGRLTKDSELRYTESEKAVGNFNIAVNREYKNENGEYETDFFNCVAYGKVAETMQQYTHKGDLVGVKGRLQSRNYEDKEGKKHYVVEVIPERITFLQAKKEEKNEYKDMSIKTEQQQQFEINPEDLPF